MPDISFTNLKNAAAGTIIGEINKLIEGANSDIQTFAVAIANDTVEAAIAGNTDVLAQLADQTKLLIEANRLRIVAGAEDLVLGFIRTALTLAIKIAIPAIPAL